MGENASESLPVYILIHSPLVGPTTWSLVAQHLEKHGHDVIVPYLLDSNEQGLPYWQQHAESVVSALNMLPAERAVILVAHSGAGVLLPAISKAIDQPVAAYLFVDAGIPIHTMSRMEAIRREDADQAAAFERTLQSGERYPVWSDDQLAPIIPDADVRYHVLEEMRPRGEDFFTEPIPVPENWPDAPVGYIILSPTYEKYVELARQRGWPIRQFKGVAHFHMLVDPAAVAEAIQVLVKEMRRSP